MRTNVLLIEWFTIEWQPTALFMDWDAMEWQKVVYEWCDMLLNDEK